MSGTFTFAGIEYEDSVSGGADMWLDILSPQGYIDFFMNPTPEKAYTQAVHFSVKSALVTTAATGAWFLSSPHWRPIVGRPDLLRMTALRADTYRAVAQQAPRVVRTAGTPVAAAAGTLALFYGADYAMRGLTDGATGILPDKDFMRWTMYG